MKAKRQYITRQLEMYTLPAVGRWVMLLKWPCVHVGAEYGTQTCMGVATDPRGSGHTSDCNEHQTHSIPPEAPLLPTKRAVFFPVGPLDMHSL